MFHFPVFLKSKMAWDPKFLNYIYFWIKHSCLDKVFYCKFHFLLFYNVNSKIKPLKVCVGVCIRSHVKLIVTVFNSCSYLQITHRKAGIECYIWLGLSDLIVKIIKNNILSAFFDYFINCLLSFRLINERAIFNMPNEFQFVFLLF